MRRVVPAVAVLLVAGAAHARQQCQEVSEVVGERRCSTFGFGWSTERSPPLFVALGGLSSFVRPVGSAFDGEVSGANGKLPFEAARFVRGPIQSYGGDLRVGGFFGRNGYVAFDVGFALGHARGEPYERGGYRLSPASGVNFVHARVGPVIGFRVPLGHLSLRFETVTAFQALLLMTRVDGPEGTNKQGGTGGAMLAIEPRVALDLWLTPDTTLSAWGGTNVLRPGDVSTGVSLAAHFRAFDGAF